MKILKLIIKNINSLYGTWEIDFTAREYAAGLFAITGSTGSGKTTILDAISLALFAETPRIQHGSNREVISRGTNECLAELTFESGGDCYMATFSYSPITKGRRAGQINEQYAHRLVKNGIEIGDKTSAVKKLVEEITGLDRERFTRSAMLAQGQFDAFLTAAGDNKAAILEQITGTEIYSRLAAKVRQFNDNANNRLSELTAARGGILLLSAEEEAEKQADLLAWEAQKVEKQKEAAFLSDQLKIVENLESIAAAIEKNAGARTALAEEAAAFSPASIRLANGRKAEPARSLYETLKELRKANDQAFAEMEQLAQALPEQEQLAKRSEVLAEETLESLKKSQASHAETQKKVNEVRLLDAAITDQKKQVDRLDKVLEKEKKIRSDAEKKIRSTVAEQQTLEEKRKISEIYRNDHREDASLPEKAAEWSGSLRQIMDRRVVALTLKKEAELAEKKLLAAGVMLSEAEKSLAVAEEKLKPLDETIASLQKQLGEQESRESLLQTQQILLRNMRTITTITNLADERSRLQKKEPCPLCGALEHPYADDPNVIPVMDENEKDLNHIAEKLAALDTLEKDLRNAENRRYTAGTERDKALSAKEIAENNRSHAAAERDEKQRLYAEEVRMGREKWSELQKTLSGEGFELAEKADSLPPAVTERINAFRNAEKSLQEFNGRSAEIQSAMALAEQERSGAAQRIADAEKEQQEHQAELDRRKEERFSLWGDGDPEQELARVTAEMKSAENKRIEAGKESVRAAEILKNTRERQAKLAAESGKRAAAIHEAENVLNETCRTIGLAQEDLEKYLLAPAELAGLAAKEADLAARKNNLTAEQNTLQTAQEEALKKRQTELDRTTLQKSVRQLNGEVDQQSGIFGALRKELEQNEENKKRYAEKEVELKKQKEQVTLWGRLHNLIGKGNLFQRVAQGITLDNLLNLANGELRNLYARYELIRSEKEQLGIDVVDHEQGDEIRTSSNLSGGEKFVVSLALALGLSRMAGEKIRIDSFFLDEGFGTLDSNSLQIVLHTLSQLRNAGKLVGIISHVSNLADEIPCVITVTKNGGGRSTLAGPGVSHKA